MTAEEWADRERHYRMAQERAAYHEAKAREQEERERKASSGA